MKWKIFILATALAATAFSYQAMAKKRCEKCERGPDGKMVCVEVACPG